MFKRALLALTLAILPLQSAIADRDHRDRGRDRGHQRSWDRHHYTRYDRRPRTSVSFSFGTLPYYRPYPYYRPAQVIYAPQPAVVQREVVYINDSNSREVSSNDGRYCREYQAVSRIGGVSQQTYGTACMQPDGSWEIVS